MNTLARLHERALLPSTSLWLTLFYSILFDHIMDLYRLYLLGVPPCLRHYRRYKGFEVRVVPHLVIFAEGKGDETRGPTMHLVQKSVRLLRVDK